VYVYTSLGSHERQTSRISQFVGLLLLDDGRESSHMHAQTTIMW